MPLESLPTEILSEIFRPLNNTFDKSYKQCNTYNLMRMSKMFYSIGFPFLYTDIFLTDPVKSTSFFDSLSDKGHLVRRLRINEECVDEKFDYESHKRRGHVGTPGRYLAIGQYCPNLREFVAEGSCVEERIWRRHCVRSRGSPERGLYADLSQHWITNIVARCSKLETFLLPNNMNSDRTISQFYPPLKHLTRLYLKTHTELLSGLLDIAESCKLLREVSFCDNESIKVGVFAEFLQRLPKLECLYLKQQYFYDDVYTPANPVHLATILRIVSEENHCLRTLVLRGIQLPVILPNIAPSCFPKLRVLDIHPAEGGMRVSPDYVSNEHVINLPLFLQNLPALEILHIDARICILPGNTGTVCDVLLPKVQIFTVLGDEFRQMDEVQQAMIVAAVDIGRLVDNCNVDEEQWSGVEVDKVVLGWENLDHEMTIKAREKILLNKYLRRV